MPKKIKIKPISLFEVADAIQPDMEARLGLGPLRYKDVASELGLPTSTWFKIVKRRVLRIEDFTLKIVADYLADLDPPLYVDGQRTNLPWQTLRELDGLWRDQNKMSAEDAILRIAEVKAELRRLEAIVADAARRNR
jgi:hypothetical protein